MADYTITISVDSNGNFTFSPSALHVSSGNDTLQWQSTHQFVVEFMDDTPLDASPGITVLGTSGQGSPTYPYGTVAQPVDDEANGHYHYAVALFDGTNLYLDANCPVIIAN